MKYNYKHAGADPGCFFPGGGGGGQISTNQEEDIMVTYLKKATGGLFLWKDK